MGWGDRKVEDPEGAHIRVVAAQGVLAEREERHNKNRAPDGALTSGFAPYERLCFFALVRLLFQDRVDRLVGYPVLLREAPGRVFLANFS